MVSQEPTELKKVSVVVPVYNAESTLEQCIEALRGQDYPETYREIIMVDNNSTDRSAAIIQAHGDIRYVEEAHQGPAAARNRGASAASHDLLVFTDSDCLPDRAWLRTLAAVFDEDSDLDVAGGEIVPHSLERYLARMMWRQGLLVQQRMILRKDPFPFCISANMAIRKEVFDGLGGFSLEYPLASGEDMALGFELYRQGGHFGYVPDAIVRHHHRSSWRQLYHQFVRYGQGSARFYTLNAGHFPNKKVALETDGAWSIKKDCRELARVTKFWLLRSKGKHDADAFRFEEILFAYCTDRGWNVGKRALRHESRGKAMPPTSPEQKWFPKLIIMLTPCCWREYYVPLTMLGKQFEERDYEVHFLYGHGGACTFLGWLEGWTEDKCASQFDSLKKQIGRPDACEVLKEWITPAMEDEAARFIETHRHAPFETLAFQGLNLWEVVRGSVCRDLRERLVVNESHTIDSTPVLEKYARAMVTAYRSISAYLDATRPDAVMVFNGFLYQERLMSELARARGCRVIAHENSCFRDRKIFSNTGYVGNWTDPAAENRFRLRARVISDDQRRRLHDYLDGIFSGKVNTISQAQPDTEEEVRRKLGISPDKRIALLIGQVPFDVVMVYDLRVFDNMLAFIRKTIEVFRDIPDHVLVIRLHPFEEVIGDDKTWKQLQDIDIPENVRVVHSKEINTYSIMDIADFGIASTSQAALEMAAMRKPVMLAGEAFFGGHGFTHDVSNLAAFEHTIKTLSRNPAFTPDMEQSMERFLYHIIFEHQIPYDRDTWAFSPEAANRIAGMIGLSDMHQIEGGTTKTFNRPERVRHVLVPQPGERLDGWCPMGASLELVDTPDDTEHSSNLVCRTDSSAWSGVGFGCTKPNQCDNRTIECKKQCTYYVSVELKAVDGSEGIPLQLHVIGSGSENFGSQKIVLTPEWKTISHAIRTTNATDHLGIQIVKVNHPCEAAFAVANLAIETQFSWLDLV